MDGSVAEYPASFFDYPLVTRCVWPDGHTTSLVPRELNAATPLFLAAATAVAVHAAVRAHRRGHAQQRTTQ